jgi:hypothetical protein
MNKFIKPERSPEFDPASYYNEYKVDHALHLFVSKNETVKKYIDSKVDESEY